MNIKLQKDHKVSCIVYIYCTRRCQGGCAPSDPPQGNALFFMVEVGFQTSPGPTQCEKGGDLIPTTILITMRPWHLLMLLLCSEEEG